MKKIFLLSLGIAVLFVATGVGAADGAPVYRWTTLAGRATGGSEDGPATTARFNHPHGLALDPAGNLYAADTWNHTIRKITPEGLTSTFAGTAGQAGSSDGAGSSARFNAPQGLAIDASGNLYVADTGNHTIRKITPAGIVTTLAGQAGKAGRADGAAAVALFDSPDRLTVEANGTVYLANGGVRKISGGLVQTIPIPTTATMPDGKTTTISVFGCPAVDAAGLLHFWAYSTGYYSETYPWGVLVTLEANGALTSTERLQDPALGTGGNFLFNDAAGNLFAVIDYTRLVSGQEYIAGASVPSQVNSSLAAGVRFVDTYAYPSKPQGCAVDQSGHWYYTRASDSAIIRDRSVLAGVASGPKDGAGLDAHFDRAYYMDVDATGNVWVSESGWDYLPFMSSPSSVTYARLRKITPGGTVSTAYTGPKQIYYPAPNPVGLACDGAGNVYFATATFWPTGTAINRVTADSSAVLLTSLESPYVRELASDATGNLWTYSTQTWEILRRPLGGILAPVAGNPAPEIKDGKGAAAGLVAPWSFATDKSGNCYFLDATYDANNAVESCFIRKAAPDGTVTTLTPNLVKKETVNGVVIARYPTSLVVNSRGETIVTQQHGILQLDAKGAETVLGGAGATPGLVDANGDKARFTSPSSLAVDPQDNLYLLDAGVIVRKGEFLGYTPGLAAQPQSQTVNAGGSAFFNVTASGSPAPTYQWYFNGSLFQGATSNTLSFANVRSSDAGDYTVVITNPLGSATSSKATLTVMAASSPTPTPAAGGGGGGATSGWFILGLSSLSLARWWKRPRTA